MSWCFLLVQFLSHHIPIYARNALEGDDSEPKVVNFISSSVEKNEFFFIVFGKYSMTKEARFRMPINQPAYSKYPPAPAYSVPPVPQTY